MVVQTPGAALAAVDWTRLARLFWDAAIEGRTRRAADYRTQVASAATAATERVSSALALSAFGPGATFGEGFGGVRLMGNERRRAGFAAGAVVLGGALEGATARPASGASGCAGRFALHARSWSGLLAPNPPSLIPHHPSPSLHFHLPSHLEPRPPRTAPPREPASNRCSVTRPRLCCPHGSHHASLPARRAPASALTVP